nr:hypothetical protein [uncultured Desulfobacter sp.]
MNKQLLTAEQSIALEKVQQLFADWRNNRTGRSRIPDNLWQAAADLHHAQGLSINKIAHSLRLNHTVNSFPTVPLYHLKIPPIVTFSEKIMSLLNKIF